MSHSQISKSCTAPHVKPHVIQQKNFFIKRTSIREEGQQGEAELWQGQFWCGKVPLHV